MATTVRITRIGNEFIEESTGSLISEKMIDGKACRDCHKKLSDIDKEGGTWFWVPMYNINICESCFTNIM